MLVVLGAVGLGLFLVVSALASNTLFVWMLALVGLFNGMAASNSWAITQVLAGPEMLGRWTGVQNFVGNFAGGVAAALTGFLLDRTGQYYLPFFVAAAIAWCGAICWMFLVGRVEEVAWDK